MSKQGGRQGGERMEVVTTDFLKMFLGKVRGENLSLCLANTKLSLKSN